jgi:GH25 family lysozyme M1 (1,4-beta-N-acetylmuramidase)
MWKRSLVAVGVAAALLADVAGFAGVAPAHAASWLTGVDVSHWNGTINWTSVAGAGITFAIQKASESQTYVDPTYETNRNGATAAGIKFTGYHFARPDTSANDAVLEADHFVETADLAPGDIIPALDLEDSGGLGVTALQNWTMAWMDRVTFRLGVKPMIYSSPGFWTSYMGNTTMFATAGYKTLWIAHWTSNSAPTVPANNWGGYGWTFWQWTDCWHVNGITGCVDGDRYNGLDLTPVLIPSATYALSVSKTGSGTGTVTSSPAGISCGATCLSPFIAGSNVILTEAPGANSSFTGWSGACSGTSSTCTVAMSAAKSVSASFLDLSVPRATITAPTTITGPVEAAFSEIVRPVTLSNFILTVTGNTTPLPGSLTCRDGGGSVVNCSTGNVVKATLTPSSALIPGQYYTAQVDPSGASPKVSDVDSNAVALTTQSFRGVTSQQETTPAAAYKWRTVSNANAYNGSYNDEHLGGAEASFPFTGTTVTWYTVTGPSQGLAYVYIDGVLKGSYNQYASSAHYKVARTFSGLTAAAHTIRIVVRGVKGSSAGTGTYVSIDAIAVGATVTGSPSLQVLWRTSSSSSASGGKYANTDLPSSATFVFRGTGVDWYTMFGPDQGKAQMWVDGVLKATYDNYASSRSFGVRRSIRSLTDSVHTLKIVVLGQKRTASSGKLISVDRFVAI